jgi:formate hydrogenlyase transcriptional activator
MLAKHERDLRQPPPSFAPQEFAPMSVLHLAFEAAPYGIIVLAEDGTIEFVNARACAIFAYSQDELRGQPLCRLLPELTSPVHSDQAHDDPCTEFWKDPESRAMTANRSVAGMRKDGVMLPLEIDFRLLANGATRHAVISMADITARLNLEARLAAARNAHLGFQRLVTDVAARFVAVDPDAFDGTVVDSLREIGEALQLDWVILWRRHSREPVADPTHYWINPSCPSRPEALAIASIPSVIASVEAGEAYCVTSVDGLPDPREREVLRRHGVQSGAVVPLARRAEGEGVLSALALGSMTRQQEWAPIVERLRLAAGVISQAFARQASHLALQKAQEEIRRLRDRLASENVELRREVKVLRMSRPIVSESAAIQRVVAQIEQVAPTPATVLLLGETGTGKEVIAQAIHDLSPRHQRTMVRVSCAAIPTALIESELFGRERGAYTGALSRQVGRFEAANQSTLFLDEIGDLPMEVQVKLLRALQDRVIERLGSTQSIKLDVRIIAATNRSLEDAVRDKTFREDLFYRLNVFPIAVPPLRERIEDIPGLVWAFIDEFSRMFGKSIDSISKDSMRELQRYPWPGNVRELRNIIERAFIVATGRQLVVSAPRLGQRPLPQAAMTLSALEIEHIRAVLESTNWRVRGSGGAAERLGLKPTTLESRMARLGIARRKAS